jgi:hypothetical protein
MQEWHGIRDADIQNQRSNTDNWKLEPGTMLQQELRKDERSERDIGSNQNATMAYGIKT